MNASNDGQHVWERDAAWWHASFALLLVVTAVMTLVQDVPPTHKVAATALLAGIAAWYGSVGRVAVRRYDSRQGVIYLIGVLLLFVPLWLFSPAAWIMLFGLCPQSFVALPARRPIVAVLALGLGAVGVVAYWSSGWNSRVLVWAAIILGLGVTLSAVQHAWIGRIISQSKERADLIADLEATRAELAAAQREAGVLTERERLAREIHDTLAQGFSSVLMLLQAAEPDVGRDPAQARRHLALAQRTVRENLDEARALVAALAPAPLDATSLDDALHRLVERFRTETRLSADFRVDGEPPPLPAAVKVVLLRATQEALANVRKHADANALDVCLSYDDRSARLAVNDDGRGFEPGRANGGYGLRGMRGRVEQVGGTLETKSAPGDGTTITVRVPVGAAG